MKRVVLKERYAVLWNVVDWERRNAYDVLGEEEGRRICIESKLLL